MCDVLSYSLNYPQSQMYEFGSEGACDVLLAQSNGHYFGKWPPGKHVDRSQARQLTEKFKDSLHTKMFQYFYVA